jgi:glycosyltransferase involved in cell wall biosynthesis
MKLSVVIPTYNRKALINRTLLSVIGQTFSPNEFEIVVVVDGATDGTAAALREIKSPCLLRVFEQPNKGAAAARNARVNVASGELVLFLDDDIRCDRHLVAAHVAAHENRKQALVHGRIIVSPDGKPTLATDKAAVDTEDFYRSLPDSGIKLPQDAHVLCNSSLPRALFLACGGFDENMPFQRDDCEFGIWLWKMGGPSAIARKRESLRFPLSPRPCLG